MGNKFARRRTQIDDRYTRTQGLYLHQNLDQKKLRRLIIDAKIAPCYPGAEDAAIDLDECPICFLNYPSLNRSKCCTKGICTECFLQVKAPNSARPTQCPFCKTPNYAVEYLGARTLEEKDVEQAEEQKVIEAKIRIRRQQEIQDEEERLQRREQAPQEAAPPVAAAREGEQEAAAPEGRSPEPAVPPERNWDPWTNSGNSAAIGYPQSDVYSSRQAVFSSTSARNSNTTSSFNTNRRSPWRDNSGGPGYPPYNRDEDFDLDLEDIMVMEAIWLSIQEQGNPRPAAEQIAEPEFPAVVQGEPCSVTGGFASAIAVLAERGVNAARVEVAAESDAESVDSGSVSNAHGSSETQSLEEQIRIVSGTDSGLDSLATQDKAEEKSGVVEARTMGMAAAAAAAVEGLSPATGSINSSVVVVADSNNNNNNSSNSSSNNNNENLTRWIRRGMSSVDETSPDALHDQGSEVVEAGTSCCSSVPSVLPWEAPEEDHLHLHLHQHPEEESFGSVGAAGVSDVEGSGSQQLDESAALQPRRGGGGGGGGGGVGAAAAAATATRFDSATSVGKRGVPESFEEQMMMAMALSLAEARALAL